MTTSFQRLSIIFSRFGVQSRSIHAQMSFLALRRLPFWSLVALTAALISGGAFWMVHSFTDDGTAPSSHSATKQDRRAASKQRQPIKSVARLRVVNDKLALQVKANMPKGLYLVIDTAANRVFLRRGEKTINEMVASCGSGNVLENPKGGKDWIFDTPRGQYRIQTKVTKPVWTKPDWAFIEEGEEIPKDPALRSEPGMMGDYALGIGQGYFIHGTLYSRLLGRNVSHGCVRLGDKDLEEIYRLLPIGAQVIIF